ncbi:hypothetical protein KC359_g22 [Hortaea werneckii]|nr:hypothetical protein KC359_g22 [Hortaea werneckii]
MSLTAFSRYSLTFGSRSPSVLRAISMARCGNGGEDVYMLHRGLSHQTGANTDDCTSGYSSGLPLSTWSNPPYISRRTIKLHAALQPPRPTCRRVAGRTKRLHAALSASGTDLQDHPQMTLMVVWRLREGGSPTVAKFRRLNLLTIILLRAKSLSLAYSPL